MLVVIAGPTGVGKSDFAVALAKKIDGEIISADSMQIYKGFDIGTAKITPDEMCGVPHHMIDIVDAGSAFSVSEYKQMSKVIIDDILSRGKTPILVGGTGLYIDAVLHPFRFGGSDDAVRQKYVDLAEELGAVGLHDLLASKDARLAECIHPNNIKRVIRALERLELGWEEDELTENEYDYIYIVLDMERQALYERVNKRVDKMFRLGLEQEVAHLSQSYPWDCQAMQAIGYKEWWDFFEGKCTIDEVRDRVMLDSRHYVKRQLTWFRAKDEAVWFDVSDKDLIIKYILDKLKKDIL